MVSMIDTMHKQELGVRGEGDISAGVWCEQRQSGKINIVRMEDSPNNAGFRELFLNKSFPK